MGASTNDTNGHADAAAAVEQDNLFIPLIDLAPFLSPTSSREERFATASAILTGFRNAGFIYLKNHGITTSEISRTFSLSAEFFKRSKAEKEGLAWDSPENNRGYTSMGREKVAQSFDKDEVAGVRETEGEDLKESYEIGRDDVAGSPNSWPKDDAGKVFRSEMLEFHGKCKQLHVELMRALALGLGIDETWFDPFTARGDNTLRLLHYPEVKKTLFQERKGQVRAGAHSDYGSITLLFQDHNGGLQVQSPNGTFVNATPIEGTIIVNAGDLLARWSNDMIKSTIHRVVEPPVPKDGDAHPPRYSMAYFCHPDYDKQIDVIPGTIVQGATKKYEGVNSGDYLVQRLSATY